MNNLTIHRVRQASANRGGPLEANAGTVLQPLPNNDTLPEAMTDWVGEMVDMIMLRMTSDASTVVDSSLIYMAKKKILIVEDDQDILQGLALRLRAHDYHTAEAPGAGAAIHLAVTEKPDLILLDIGLPDGDGLLVVEHLKTIPALADVPVIVVSARDPMVNRERAFNIGVKAFFQKPVDNDALLSAIRYVLDQD